MAKIEKALDKAKGEVGKFADSVEDKFDQLINDKYDRAKKCFEKLQEAGIRLCFKADGKIITSYDQIKDIGIDRIDIFGESINEHCLWEFANHGIIQCEEIHTCTDDSVLCAIENYFCDCPY